MYEAWVWFFWFLKREDPLRNFSIELFLLIILIKIIDILDCIYCLKKGQIITCNTCAFGPSSEDNGSANYVSFDCQKLESVLSLIYRGKIKEACSCQIVPILFFDCMVNEIIDFFFSSLALGRKFVEIQKYGLRNSTFIIRLIWKLIIIFVRPATAKLLGNFWFLRSFGVGVRGRNDWVCRD